MVTLSRFGNSTIYAGPVYSLSEVQSGIKEFAHLAKIAQLRHMALLVRRFHLNGHTGPVFLTKL